MSDQESPPFVVGKWNLEDMKLWDGKFTFVAAGTPMEVLSKMADAMVERDARIEALEQERDAYRRERDDTIRVWGDAAEVHDQTRRELITAQGRINSLLADRELCARLNKDLIVERDAERKALAHEGAKCAEAVARAARAEALIATVRDLLTTRIDRDATAWMAVREALTALQEGKV